MSFDEATQPPKRSNEESLHEVPELAAANEQDDDWVPGQRTQKPWIRVIAVLAIIGMVGGLVSGLFGVFSQGDTASDVVAQISEAADGERVVANVAGGGRAEFAWSVQNSIAGMLITGVEPAESGMAYAMWLQRGDEVAPIGNFAVDTDGRAEVEFSGALQDNDTVLVTLEKYSEGGSQLPEGRTMVAIPVRIVAASI